VNKLQGVSRYLLEFADVEILGRAVVETLFDLALHESAAGQPDVADRPSAMFRPEAEELLSSN